jgi:hypothetical protein
MRRVMRAWAVRKARQAASASSSSWTIRRSLPQQYVRLQ